MLLYFHDPYPASLYPGSKSKLNTTDFYKIKEMREIVSDAKAVFSPSKKLSSDLGFLFGRSFKTLPHQFDENIFKNYKTKFETKLDDNFLYITYHGAIQHNRSLDLLLTAFVSLVDKNYEFNKFKFVIRSKGLEVNKLKALYKNNNHILFLKKVSAFESFYEQKKYSSLSIVLETDGEYSNILSGKVPMLSDINSELLCLTSKDSELKRLLKNSHDNFSDYDEHEIYIKLNKLLNNLIDKKEINYPLKEYFSDKEFVKSVKDISNA